MRGKNKSFYCDKITYRNRHVKVIECSNGLIKMNLIALNMLNLTG